MVALDSIVAINTVDYHLLNDNVSSNLSKNTIRWIIAYLRGKYTYGEFKDTKSNAGT